MIADPDFDFGREVRRGIAFERVFRIAHRLRGQRLGVHLQDLVREVSEQTGHDWHARTIRRDINLLEYLGCVQLENSIAKWVCPEDLLSVNPERVRDAATLAVLESKGLQLPAAG